MAYKRQAVKDYETVMNSFLYNNLQDGIDDLRADFGDDFDRTRGSVQVQIDKNSLKYNEETHFLESGVKVKSEEDIDVDDVITPDEISDLFDQAKQIAESGN